MAKTLKNWLVTVHNHAAGENEDVKVTAHQLTCEPSGALTFWAVRDDNMQAFLMFGFAANAWLRVEVLPDSDS